MFERNRIAEVLRNAREEQGLSLEQAAASSGIPLQYIRLLEGESNVRIGVSDELYLIPFFRRYAAFFGIDAEQMLPEFLGVVQQLPGEGSPPIRLTYRPRWGFLWRPAAVLITIGIAVLLMLRQAPERPTFDDSAAGDKEPLEQSEPNEIETAAVVATTTPAPADATAVPVAAVEPSSLPTASAAPAAMATAAATPVAAGSSTPTVAPTGAHELKITAVEEAWLSVAVDDQPTKQYMLRAGETRTWSAGVFSLTVGNAGGVTVAVDGRDLPPIGKPGKVVRNLRLPQPSTSPSPVAQ
jgi:cytoskeleton protein RodZ